MDQRRGGTRRSVTIGILSIITRRTIPGSDSIERRRVATQSASIIRLFAGSSRMCGNVRKSFCFGFTTWLGITE